MAQKRRLPGWACCDPNPSSQAFLDPTEASTSSARAAEESSERAVPQKRKNASKKTQEKQESSPLQRNQQIVQESRTPAKSTISSAEENDSVEHLAKTKERIIPEKSAYSGRSSDESEKKKGKEKVTETRLGQKMSPRGGDASAGDKEVALVERGLQADQHRGKQKGGSRNLQLNQDTVPPPPSHSNAKQTSPPFSKLLDGVVFAISGLVNPERAELRTKALEMGASYQPDWNDDCTLLISAFVHTPKFLQVKAQGGTIVAKDWIIECYKQRELVDMDKYLLFSGRRWRKGRLGDAIDTGVEDDELWIPPGQIREPKKSGLTNENEEDTSLTTLGTSTKELGMKIVTQHGKGEHFNNCSKVLEADDFEVQQWAHEDLQAITKWLQQQENKEILHLSL